MKKAIKKISKCTISDNKKATLIRKIGHYGLCCECDEQYYCPFKGAGRFACDNEIIVSFESLLYID